MKTYARIVDGLMVERFDPLVLDGVPVSVEERFHPDFVAQLTEIDPLNPPPTLVPPSEQTQ